MYLYNVCTQVPRHSSRHQHRDNGLDYHKSCKKTCFKTLGESLQRPHFSDFMWGLNTRCRSLGIPECAVNHWLHSASSEQCWNAVTHSSVAQLSKIEADLRTKGLPRSSHFLRTQYYNLLNSWAANGVWQCHPPLLTAHAARQGCGRWYW